MERRLAAIFSADVVGYSRLMGADEAGTLARMQGLKAEILDPLIAQHHGRVVKLMGDGFLIEFASVVDALTCALAWQQAVEARADQVSQDRALRFRIGVNLGDVMVEADDIYGDGVNVAARLEGIAQPGTVLVSRTVFNHTNGKVAAAFEDLGEQALKNIAEPVRVFRVSMASEVAKTPTPATDKSRSRRLSVIAAALALLVVAVGAALWLRPWAPREELASVAAMAFPLPDKPSIAVLPFNNMSGDQSQEYFTDGMTEDLITDLSKISGLFVIARNSSFSYKGQQVKVRQVAEELGVRYVLEGSVRRAGNEVRINTQLIDATTGAHVWAERYDGSLADVFALQDKVTREIVGALAVMLTDKEEARQAQHDTDDLEAYDAFLQGWSRYKLGTPSDLARAIPYFDEAIRLDPNYAQVHAALAAVYWDAFENDWAFDLDMPSFRAESRANEHLEEALKAPTPLAHALQARMFAALGFPGEAVVEAEKAVALDENDATALAGLANALVLAERPEEGMEFIRKAMRLDPHHPPSYLITLGAAQFGMEQYGDAAATFERAVKRNPDNELPWIYLASSYGHLRRIEEADDAIEAANDLRAKVGMGKLSLEKAINDGIHPFEGEIDFAQFGSSKAQARVRAGLSEIPLLTWQYLITTHPVLGAGNTWWEIEGATQIDLETAKSFHDQGVTFVSVDNPDAWRAAHIPGSVSLPYIRPADPDLAWLRKEWLMEIVDERDPVVFYCFSEACLGVIFGSAMAVNWGYRNLSFLAENLAFKGQYWKAAGYPIETAE